MRRVLLVAVLLAFALAVGCAKKTVETGPPPPTAAAFAESSMENTLSWLATQKNALDAAGDKEAAEKFKSLAESMKGRSITWNSRIGHVTSDKTCVLSAHRIQKDAPEPPTSEGTRARHYAIVCTPFSSAKPIQENEPFGKKLDVGFPSNPPDAEWVRRARAGTTVRLTGTIAAVQLHSNSWVTGYGLKDRVVHTEIGITVHVASGTVSPAP